jgi:hypothetical protein
MKLIATFLLFTLLASCASSKETKYTGSTPAAPLVRTFLGILLTDSVDFIRWNLTLTDNRYTLNCNYGIGKPNTNGFYDGGKKIEISGAFKKEKNNYLLQNGNQILKLAELNNNLLHILNDNNSLMIGNGGFSYLLNNMAPTLTDRVSIASKKIALKDSMAFQGRTLCEDFSINRPGHGCIKMKWSIVFYANVDKNEPTTYLLNRSNMLPLEYPGKKGTWKIIAGKDGRIIYVLTPDMETTPTYLLKLDEGVLIFTNANGNLLVGNHDFSYTLNRRF